MLGLLADVLYMAVDYLYMEIFEMLLNHWEESATAFNAGQYSIYSDYISVVVDEWLDEAGGSWPDADADYYVDYCFQSYDPEVLERAFSDTIFAPVDDMWEIIYSAQELYEAAEMFEAMSFL